MVCGYDTGRLEIWHQSSVVYWKKVIIGWELSLLFVDQLVKITLPSFGWKYLNERLCVCCIKVSDGALCAVTGMPEDQLAVACSDCSVFVWKLERDTKKSIVRYQLLSLFTFIFQFQFCKRVAFQRNVPF